MIWRWLRATLLRGMAPQGKKRWYVLVAGLLAIVLWQCSFVKDSRHLDGMYGIRGLSGMHNEPTFVYFAWYEGLFPVASTLAVGPCEFHCDEKLPSGAPAELSKEAAEQVMHEHPESLVQDLGWTWNGGDRGKIYLFYLDVLLKGGPFAPTIKPMNELSFIGALCGLFFAAWRIRRPLLGALLVLFIGSDPLQLLEVYNYANVFGWTITTATILLALHLGLMAQPRMVFRRALGLAVVVGLFMATIRTFRSEPMPLLLGPGVLYLGLSFPGITGRRRVWLHRVAVGAALTASFVIANAAWNFHFEYRTAHAGEVLARLGGHPYPGSMRLHHHFWHPVYCGLGDFDKKHGYEWRDGAALEYAAPILQRDFHQYVPSTMFQDTRHNLDEYMDPEFVYKRMPYSVPNYDEVVRDKVLADIKGDPVWYVGILGQRTWRVLTETTPLRVSWQTGWSDVLPFTGLTAIPFLLLFIVARAKFAARLVAFTMPSCMTALIVYSGGGVRYYSIFHMLAAAALALILGGALWRVARVLVTRFAPTRKKDTA
jgi:hypothetical protein